MVGGPMKLAVNEFLLRPDALEVVSGLAVAGGLGVRQIWKTLGMRTPTYDEAAELELLDEHAPKGFWSKAVSAVHTSLVAKEFRGRGNAIIPHVGWYHDIWSVEYRGFTWDTDPGFDDEAKAYDLTDIGTPVMVDGKLV